MDYGFKPRKTAQVRSVFNFLHNFCNNTFIFQIFFSPPETASSCCWQTLSYLRFFFVAQNSQQVYSLSSFAFISKCSLVHYFWGFLNIALGKIFFKLPCLQLWVVPKRSLICSKSRKVYNGKFTRVSEPNKNKEGWKNWKRSSNSDCPRFEKIRKWNEERYLQ